MPAGEPSTPAASFDKYPPTGSTPISSSTATASEGPIPAEVAPTKVNAQKNNGPLKGKKKEGVKGKGQKGEERKAAEAESGRGGGAATRGSSEAATKASARHGNCNSEQLRKIIMEVGKEEYAIMGWNVGEKMRRGGDRN